MSLFTSVATKVYKDPLTTTWANTLKSNEDYFEKMVPKVWCVVDLSTTSTITCLASENVANVTYASTGRWTVGYTTGFTTSDYAVFSFPHGSTGGIWGAQVWAQAATSAQCVTLGSSNGVYYNTLASFLAVGTGA